MIRVATGNGDWGTKSPLIGWQSEISQGDSKGRWRRLSEDKWDSGEREAAGDGATIRSVEAF